MYLVSTFCKPHFLTDTLTHMSYKKSRVQVGGIYFWPHSDDVNAWQPDEVNPLARWRLVLPASLLVTRCPRLFFADHVRASDRGPAHALLLLARARSDAEKFAKRKLPQLPLAKNPLFKFDTTAPSGDEKQQRHVLMSARVSFILKNDFISSFVSNII